jgi:hypothetical protein
MFGAFGCAGSPTQPDLLEDAATGARPRTFEPSRSFTPNALSEEFADTEFVEHDLTDESEATEDTEEIDLADFEASNLDANEFHPQSLTASTLTTAATARTVAVSGVVKDKITKRVLAGVSVKSTGRQPVTSNSRGVYRMNVSPGRRTLTFSKKGYTTKSVTGTFTRATKLDVLLASAPASLSKVSLNDSNVPVGTTVIATIKLTSAAPTGGARVFLSSTPAGVATVSASSIVIAAGATSKTFTVNAKTAGSALIKATYKNETKTADLTVKGDGDEGGGGDNLEVKFTYGPPDQCPIVPNPDEPPPLIANCTFDASASKAPANSTYEWTLPDGSVIRETDARLVNPPLKCGLPAVAFEAKVKLVIITSNGVRHEPFSLTVNFEKNGLC